MQRWSVVGELRILANRTDLCPSTVLHSAPQYHCRCGNMPARQYNVLLYAPGLSMWVLDWAMRLCDPWAPPGWADLGFGQGVVLVSWLPFHNSAVELSLYNSLSSPLPRCRLDRCACISLRAQFYIHDSASSVRELHPFTIITHLASQNTSPDPSEDDIHIQFLFRKRGIEKPVIAPEAKHGFALAVFKVIRRVRIWA
jgi:hypothetical protein